MKRLNRHPNLQKEDFGLTDSDLDTVFQAGNEIIGLNNATLREIIQRLDEVYCGSIGFEYHHIEDREKRRWIRERIESHHPKNQYDLEDADKKRIIRKLNDSVMFEHFLHKKYVGQKRFSLEGGEALIPALSVALYKSVNDFGVKECVLGMAHRGRLNTLINVFRKPVRDLFSEFENHRNTY